MSDLRAPQPFVLGPEDGDLSTQGGVRDRFMLEGHQTGGRFALVEHRFAPRALAAPMHRHHLEDEYTFVVRGHIGARLGGVDVLAGPGDLIHKPRGQWHTFWNPDDAEARVLELISPAGLEQFFRLLMESPDLDGETLAAEAARYQCDVDLESTAEVMDQHGVAF